MRHRNLLLLVLILSLLPLSSFARPFVLVISQDDLNDDTPSSTSDDGGESPEWDEFNDSDSDSMSEEKLDPGSWRPIFEPYLPASYPKSGDDNALYYSGVRDLISAVSSGDPRVMEKASLEIEAAAVASGGGGYPPAQSVLGFLYQTGQMRERNGAKAFLYHSFAAKSGSMQSKMVLASTYSRQEVWRRTQMIKNCPQFLLKFVLFKFTCSIY